MTAHLQETELILDTVYTCVCAYVCLHATRTLDFIKISCYSDYKDIVQRESINLRSEIIADMIELY